MRAQGLNGSGSPQPAHTELLRRIFAPQIWHSAKGVLPHLGQRSARLEIRARQVGQAMSLPLVDGVPLSDVFGCEVPRGGVIG